MNSYKKMWKRYGEFDGRSGRKDFWLAILFNVIILLVLDILYYATTVGVFEVIAFIYSLVIIIPMISISVRRMHDIGKNGCWILINLIPFIGQIWFIVLAAFSGDIGENDYGLPE